MSYLLNIPVKSVMYKAAGSFLAFGQNLGFDPRPVRVGFVVDGVAVGHDFLRVLQFMRTFYKH